MTLANRIGLSHTECSICNKDPAQTSIQQMFSEFLPWPCSGSWEEEESWGAWRTCGREDDKECDLRTEFPERKRQWCLEWAGSRLGGSEFSLGLFSEAQHLTPLTSG